MEMLSNTLKSLFFLLIFLHFAPPLWKNIKRNYFIILSPHTKIGRITIDSAITDSSLYAKPIKSFFKDQSIKAILLKIDSPGGITGSCQALFNEIQELKKRYPKPIITLSEDLCTSGAYYVACSSDFIITSPAALVGNIGARFTVLFDVKDLLTEWKIKSYVIASGHHKASTTMFNELSPEQQKVLQDVADDTYTQFTTDIARLRKLSFQKRNEWADGKLFTGKQALALGLIDEVGSYSQAVTKLKELAPIEGSIEWIDAQGSSTFFDMIPRSLLWYCANRMVSY